MKVEDGFGKKLLVEVRARLASIDACPRHLIIRDERTPQQRSDAGVSASHFWRCTVCGNGLDSGHVGAYVRGFVAAGGDAETVCPGWAKKVTP